MNLPPPQTNVLKEETYVESKAALVIKATVTIPILLIWFFLGLYIWIPLLIRKVGAYIGAVITSALTREIEAVQNATVNLEHAITFFMDGFRLIVFALAFSGRQLPEQRTISRERAASEFAIATIAWISLFAIYLIFSL